MELMTVHPSEVRFTQKTISDNFKNNVPVLQTLEDIISGKIHAYSLPKITCSMFEGQLWVVHGNRRLFLYQKLEACGLLDTIKVIVKPLKPCLFNLRYTSTNNGESVSCNVEQDVDNQLIYYVNGGVINGDESASGYQSEKASFTCQSDPEYSSSLYTDDNLSNFDVTDHDRGDFIAGTVIIKDVDTSSSSVELHDNTSSSLEFDQSEESTPVTTEDSFNMYEADDLVVSSEESFCGNIFFDSTNRVASGDLSMDSYNTFSDIGYNSSIQPADLEPVRNIQKQPYLEPQRSRTPSNRFGRFVPQTFQNMTDGFNVGVCSPDCSSYTVFEEETCHHYSRYSSERCQQASYDAFEGYNRERSFYSYGSQDMDVDVESQNQYCNRKVKAVRNVITDSYDDEIYSNSQTCADLERIVVQSNSWNARYLNLSKRASDRFGRKICGNSSPVSSEDSQMRFSARKVICSKNMTKGSERQVSLVSMDRIERKNSRKWFKNAIVSTVLGETVSRTVTVKDDLIDLNNNPKVRKDAFKNKTTLVVRI